jgi:hypothetical protein
MKIDFFFSQIANKRFAYLNSNNVDVEGEAVSYIMTPIKAIVMSDGTNIPFQNFHDIAQEIGGFDTSFEDENFLDHTNNEDVGMMLKNVNGGLISTNILNKELPQPNPIITLLDKAKLEETSIDIRIEDIKIPKKALTNRASSTPRMPLVYAPVIMINTSTIIGSKTREITRASVSDTEAPLFGPFATRDTGMLKGSFSLVRLAGIG